MLGNYAHAQTVDTRPFLSGWEGPGYEASNMYVMKLGNSHVQILL